MQQRSLVDQSKELDFILRATENFFDIFKMYFIEVYLIYNAVLISSLQQSDSVIHIYTHIYTFFFIFFSIMVYQSILNVVPCAIQ